MHTVQLLLKTSNTNAMKSIVVFKYLAFTHNVCVIKHARKCMIRLQIDKRYAELRHKVGRE